MGPGRTGARAAMGAWLLAGLACVGDGEQARAQAENRTQEAVITADTVDRGGTKPGTILRWGPATPEAIEGPVYPPVVAGDRGQVSIYEGYFVSRPCHRPLRAEADLQADTIIVRVIADPDTARTGPCEEVEKQLGYAMLVGQFDPGTYAVRLIHEGDMAREALLDTVYAGIAIEPRER